MTQDIKIKNENAICWITLDRPEAKNAISDNMVVELVAALEEADISNDIKVIVITGNGNSFCAGGDINDMKNNTGMFAGDTCELRLRYQRGIQRIPKVIESLQTPIIGMINGAAIGAGCDLAAMCDLRVGSTKAKFGETFNSLALVPGDGGTYFLPRVVGYAKAMEMFLTCHIYNAEEAHAMGLLNMVVEESELENRTREIGERIAANSIVAMAMTKTALKMSSRSDLNQQLELLSTYQGITQRTTDHQKRIEGLFKK